MKTLKLSKPEKSFLDYGFIGDGKYYTTEAGSRHYRNTVFSNFRTMNKDCFEILESGNDAPRGGQTGFFVVVKFNEKFYEKFNWHFAEKEAAKERAKIAENEKREVEKQIKEKFIVYVSAHPEKVEEWLFEISKLSNKRARLYKENRVARVTQNFDFWGKYRIFDEVINSNV